MNIKARIIKLEKTHSESMGTLCVWRRMTFDGKQIDENGHLLSDEQLKLQKEEDEKLKDMRCIIFTYQEPKPELL